MCPHPRSLRSYISSLNFRINKDHKNDNRAFAQYKQQTLDTKISQHYNTFYTDNLPLNPLKQIQCDIPQDQLLLLSYDIRCAWLRSGNLYISRPTIHNYLARGFHAQHVLYYTSGPPPGHACPAVSPSRQTQTSQLKPPKHNITGSQQKPQCKHRCKSLYHQISGTLPS
jgi:hypothetical protein